MTSKRKIKPGSQAPEPMQIIKEVQHSFIYCVDGRTYAGKELAYELILRWETALANAEDVIELQVYNENPANKDAKTDMMVFNVNYIGAIGEGASS